jgi:hypothetical protein
VIGVGALATSRVTARASAASTHWQEAGCLAFSAVEQAVAKINADAPLAPDTWRNAYASGQTGFTIPFGKGRMSWALVDEEDRSIADDYGDPLKVYGIGQVGAVRRVYSARLTAAGSGVDVLRTAFHAAGGLSLGGPTVVIGGPASTNGSLVLNGGGLRGNGGSEVAGGGGSAVAAVKPMPSAGVFELYKLRATVIPSAAVAGGTMQVAPLSAASNPYGDANPDGIYYVRLPDTISTLQILSSRVKGTLLVEAAPGNTAQAVELMSPSSWEPHRADLPTLITKGVATVRVYGAIAPYAEGGTSYPSELRGLFHLIGTADVQLNDATYLKGCLVADGTITTSGTVAAAADPALLAAPPVGYSRGNRVVLVPGSWKWDAPPGQ